MKRATTFGALFQTWYCVPLYELLYISELSPDTSPTTIGEILVQTRTRNKLSGITGLLLFEGEHFVQVLEGEQRDIVALMRRIECDDRHFCVTRLHEGCVESRRFHNFGVGYWHYDDETSVAKLRELRGPAAMDELRSRRAEFDVES